MYIKLDTDHSQNAIGKPIPISSSSLDNTKYLWTCGTKIFMAKYTDIFTDIHVKIE